MYPVVTLEISPKTQAAEGDEFNLAWKTSPQVVKSIMELSDDYLIDQLYALTLTHHEDLPEDFIQPIKLNVFEVEYKIVNGECCSFICAEVEEAQLDIGRVIASNISNKDPLTRMLGGYSHIVALETAYRISEQHNILVEFYVESFKMIRSATINGEQINCNY